jgi:hypothetical protein
MSKTNRPKFKVYSKIGLRLTNHPKVFSGKLGSKKMASSPLYFEAAYKGYRIWSNAFGKATIECVLWSD